MLLEMEQRTSINAQAIKVAYAKGYRIVDGEAIAPRGNKLKLMRIKSKKGDPYPYFKVKIPNGRVCHVRAHRLVAYQLYGDASTRKGIVVRHKNDDKEDFSPENIILGTDKDNSSDRDKDCVRRIARLGGLAKKKHTDDDVRAMRSDYANGVPIREIGIKYGTSTTGAKNVVLRRSYKKVV